jgi:two-component system cell cycle response regulator
MAGRILIADEVATNRIIQKVKLTAAHYDVLQAGDAAELLRIAEKERPDLIVMNRELPGGGVARVCAMLRADPRFVSTPVVALCPHGSRDGRVSALRAGADEVMALPVQEDALLALIRNLLRARATLDELGLRKGVARDFGLAEDAAGFTRPGRVVLIAPTLETGMTWRRTLTGPCRAKIEVRTGLKDFDPLARGGKAPDAFVIAADLMRMGDGLQLISELRSNAVTRHAAIIVGCDPDAPEQCVLALDMGANGVLHLPFDAEELALRLRAQIARKRQLDGLRSALDRQLDMALRDPLTGLYNRRYAQSYLGRLTQNSREQHQPFTLMVLDLDRFKSVNDTYGHAVGDEVLVEVARRLRVNLREIDLLARLGGEEFLVAMPETDRAAAAQAAERLRRIIGEVPITSHRTGIQIPVTMSIGVVVSQNDLDHDSAPEPVEALIHSADRALYNSKSDGRNQVTFTICPAA